MCFDVLVVGGGHAGVEAAHASAKLGCRTALLTLSRHTIGQMSCNPAIGGIAKGHLVREIDALGGLMGRIIDRAGIQFRMLNTGKGPAVRAPRAQADKPFYRKEAQRALATLPNLTIVHGCADRLLFEGGSVVGLRIRPVIEETADDLEASQPRIDVRISDETVAVRCQAVVIATGTFLNGRIYRGRDTAPGGREGEPGPGGLARSFRDLGLALGRHKTGTPPRILKSNIDFQRLREQPGDEPPPCFSHFPNGGPALPQVPCHITRTNERTHALIRRHIGESPLYSGAITGRGPRYCPSIEDKVVKFPDRTSHLVFLEPEGVDSPEVYPNGLSTSLPLEVQREFLRTLPGLEEAELARPGYAVEYDFVIPGQLDATLGVRSCAGLYLAGQVNGTSGYEEAAAQGIVAGMNAALRVQGRPPVSLRRSEAYIGVLIDDLITKTPLEPYRMFTSNAEFRLILRQDNADRRLAEKARALGMLTDGEWDHLRERWDAVRAEVDRLRATPLSKIARATAPAEGRDVLDYGRDKARSLSDLLKRPRLTYADLVSLGWASNLDPSDMVSAEAEIKYEGYIARMRLRLREVDDMEGVAIPPEFYDRLAAGLEGFSREATESLVSVRPATLGQAARLAGVRAAQVDLLSIWIKALRSAARPAPVAARGT